MEVNKKAWIEFMDEIQNPAPCTTPPYRRFAIRTDTDAGRATLSMLLTALASGNNLLLFGTGECTIYKGGTKVEDLSYGYILPPGMLADELPPEEEPTD